MKKPRCKPRKKAPTSYEKTTVQTTKKSTNKLWKNHGANHEKSHGLDDPNMFVWDAMVQAAMSSTTNVFGFQGQVHEQIINQKTTTIICQCSPIWHCLQQVERQLRSHTESSCASLFFQSNLWSWLSLNLPRNSCYPAISNEHCNCLGRLNIERPFTFDLFYQDLAFPWKTSFQISNHCGCLNRHQPIGPKSGQSLTRHKPPAVEASKEKTPHRAFTSPTRIFPHVAICPAHMAIYT